MPALAELRGAETPAAGVRGLIRSMLRSAYGTEAPPAGETSRLDLRAYGAALRAARRARRLCRARRGDAGRRRRGGARAGGGAARRRQTRADVSPCSTSCARAHAASRSSSCSGSRKERCHGARAPRRSSTTMLDASSAAVSSGPTRSAATATSSTPPARARRGGSTSCARLRPTTVARASPARSGRRSRPSSTRTTSRVRRCGGRSRRSPGRSSRRRPSASACARSRSSRSATPTPPARSPRRTSGSGGSFARASALRRETRLSSDVLLASYGAKTTFGVTELERFADCSSAWLFERVISPRTIDAEVDPMLRGSVAHSALHKFYAGLPKELGQDRVTPENLEQALGFLRRCLDDALRGGVRLDLTDLQEAELDESLWRDLEGFVRDEAASPLQLLPRRFEVSFGSDRSAPELQRGLPLGDDLYLSGKIDRIDVDPYSARGIVQDYKSGRTAHSAKQIDEELKLQIPLYMLVLRDLVGIEPLGGVYRALAGARVTRGPAARGRSRRPARLPAQRLPRGDRVLVARRDRARACARLRAAHPRRRRAPRSEGRRRARRGATSGRCAGWSALMNAEQRAAVEATGEVFVSAGAGTGKTTVLVERFVRRRVRAGPRRRVGARHHLHAQGRGRAARAHPRRAARARPPRPRAPARRRVDLDDPRLLLAAPARASVRGRHRPALPRARRRARRRAPRRGVRASARGVLRDARLGAVAPARDLRRAGAAPDAHRCLRDASLRGPRR